MFGRHCSKDSWIFGGVVAINGCVGLHYRDFALVLLFSMANRLSTRDLRIDVPS
jgi:hypothetical protein